eukprot:CCRYP_003693-RB/>CCRYP_003693-RB protein AED:0.07 eAED:0.07 QI:443/1/1/1/1/1/5/555/509
MENPPLLPPMEIHAIGASIPEEPSLSFSEIYNLLTAFHQATGSLTLPLSHPTTLRIIDILTALQFEELANHRWECQFAALKEYKQRHGNCVVETLTGNSTHDYDETFTEWVALQRECYRAYEEQSASHAASWPTEQQGLEKLHGKSLTNDRYLKLKNVGLTVNKWEKRLLELRQYQAEVGHCDVPIDHPGGLGIWCATQRESYKFEKASMPKERIEALDALGFTWSRWGHQRSKARKDAWDKKFDELVEYKNANGDCNISQYDENNRQLGKWAKNQRYEYRRYHNKGLGQSRISRDRIDKLESIGFQWRLKPEKITWDQRFEALKKYKEEYGHCRPPQNYPEIGTWAKYQRNQLEYFLEGKPSKVSQEKVDKLLSIGFNDPPPARNDQDGDDGMMHHHDNPELAELQRRKRARRAARARKAPEQHQHSLPPHHTHPHHEAFQPYPDQNMQQHYQPPPPYDFDVNTGHLGDFYQGYEHQTPVNLQDNGQFPHNPPMYQHGYDQYHYQTGV